MNLARKGAMNATEREMLLAEKHRLISSGNQC